MMRSLFSGVSGLKSHQSRMDVIGNNIANINTIGFKGSRTTFSDMLSQMQSPAASPTDTRGGVNPRQVGLGVNVASIDLIFSDSSPQSTGKNTDLSLSGNGLFYLKEGDQSYFTRNGAFLFDESGYYVMTGTGLRVQGWNATEEGTINSNGASTDINVPAGKTMDATETSQIYYSGNLDKESKMIKSISYTVATSDEADDTKVVTRDGDTITSVNVDGENVVAATITFRDDTKLSVTDGYYEVGKSVPISTLATIYDSLGGVHEVALLIDKDPDSTGGDATPTDAEALATGRPITKYTYTDGNNDTYDVTETVTYTYTDLDGNEHTVGANNRNITQDDNGNYTYNAADGEIYEATRVVAYTYKDANGDTQNLEESDLTTNTTTVYDNRWRVYIKPGVGEAGPASEEFANTYTRSEANGNPEMDGSSTVGTMNMVSYIYFNERGAFVSNGTTENASLTFEYSDGNGAASNQAVIDYSGLTQYANTTTSFPTTNGNTAGTLQSIAVDSNGVVSGTYTNGLIRNEAQIAVAQFTNSSGLTKVGTTVYQESNNSGAANIRTVADFGLTVISAALEMSNVDLATEFSDMIVTQRGFQANSKMTTVSDEMLETLINMKR